MFRRVSSCVSFFFSFIHCGGPGCHSAATLASASLLGGVDARALGDGHEGELLGDGGVDTHGAVEVALLGAHLHRHSVPLRPMEPSIHPISHTHPIRST